jgi:hypothetical protein
MGREIKAAFLQSKLENLDGFHQLRPYVSVSVLEENTCLQGTVDACISN